MRTAGYIIGYFAFMTLAYFLTYYMFHRELPPL